MFVKPLKKTLVHLGTESGLVGELARSRSLRPLYDLLMEQGRDGEAAYVAATLVATGTNPRDLNRSARFCTAVCGDCPDCVVALADVCRLETAMSESDDWHYHHHCRIIHYPRRHPGLDHRGQP